MSEFLPNPATHVATNTLKRLGLAPQIGAMSRRPKEIPRDMNGFLSKRHPMPHYTMWRGNTHRYQYNESFVARWGEGDTKYRYHQYFAHAKDPNDYDKPGRDFELLQVRQGKLNVKKMPEVQYVAKDAKPTWNFRSWSDLLSTLDPWGREVQYKEHVPEHLGAKRPLCPMSPTTYHKHIQLAYMDKIEIMICPFFFGYGPSIQRSVLTFYRRCLSGRSSVPKDKISLVYSVDLVSPKITVHWIDGTTYSPPVLEGVTAQGLIQRIMEQAWLQRDKLEASGKELKPLSIDDYKWNEVIKFKKVKKASAVAGKK